MTETMFVKPAPGLIVRDPETLEALPPEGKQVLRSIYWIRRLRDKDVTEAVPAAEPLAAASPAAGMASADKPKGAE